MAHDSVRGGASMPAPSEFHPFQMFQSFKMFKTKTYHKDREAHEHLQEYLTTEADATETRKR